MRFSPDGRVFVAEKSGLIKVFDSLSDPTPTVFADLRTQVHNYWDRGLLGIALDPNFPAKPYVYVLYTYDAAIGGTAPLWGTPRGVRRPCPTPPGPTTTAAWSAAGSPACRQAGTTMTGAEKVLINDWCQQFPSHSVGDLAVRRRTAPSTSAAARAPACATTDYGQPGGNPCGDPPAAPGHADAAHRRGRRACAARASADPRASRPCLDGTILRVDPSTGDGLPDNPLAASTDANARRIVAYGLRNPFRFASGPAPRALDRRRRAGQQSRRSTGSPTPTQPRHELRLALLRGCNPQPGYDAPA